MNSSKEESLLLNNNGVYSLINADDFNLVEILISILTNNGLESLQSFISMLMGHRKEIGDEFLEYVHKTIAEERYYLYNNPIYLYNNPP